MGKYDPHTLKPAIWPWKLPFKSKVARQKLFRIKFCIFLCIYKFILCNLKIAHICSNKSQYQVKVQKIISSIHRKMQNLILSLATSDKNDNFQGHIACLMCGLMWVIFTHNLKNSYKIRNSSKTKNILVNKYGSWVLQMVKISREKNLSLSSYRLSNVTGWGIPTLYYYFTL